MVSKSSPALKVGEWRATPRLGRIERAGETRALEPKVMDLLVLLAKRPGEVLTHEEILAALWPNVVVGDDALARCVSKLRRAFDDDPKAARYVETIPKRGYRLIADVAPVEAEGAAPGWLSWPRAAAALALLIVLALGGALLATGGRGGEADTIARAKDYYFRYTRADNEAAIALFEQALVAEPNNAEAKAGLAVATVQQVLRWPGPPGDDAHERTTLGEALESGRTDTAEARSRLMRARTLAETAVRAAPRDYFAHQALGLTLAASRDFAGAERAHARAIALNPDAWGALINLGDLKDIQGRPSEALPYYERAFEAMQRAYANEPQRIGVWQGELGALIAERHAAARRSAQAEEWYRRVLRNAPMHAGATSGLALLLAARGEDQEAIQLCDELVRRSGPNEDCARLTR